MRGTAHHQRASVSAGTVDPDLSFAGRSVGCEAWHMDDRQRPARAHDALRLWSQFPVDAEPRPLVLAGVCVHAAGFDSDEAKVAFVEGAIEEDVVLPPGVLAAMCSSRRTENARFSLTVTDVRRTTGRFQTDRGERRFPAWEVTLTHALGAFVVLDPQVAATAWHPPGRKVPEGIGLVTHATLHEDGRTLTLTFVGTPREYADYPRADVVETDTAVMVLPVLVNRGGSGARRAYAENRQVTAALSQPLGARVLLTSSGWPVPVMSPQQDE
jgi:hypothetical protein